MIVTGLDAGGYEHRCRNGLIARECPACAYVSSRVYGWTVVEAQSRADDLARELGIEAHS